ncbi:MAG TPA: hypothetical protein VGW31_13355 [Hanamia sp.]|nr:hypothetical protein [Hanamia sp.]
MKTRTMAMSLMLAFASCAVFANNQVQDENRFNTVTTDTIPTDTIPKDSIPKKDTLLALNTPISLQVNSESILKDNSGVTDLMKAQTVYANLPSKESISR